MVDSAGHHGRVPETLTLTTRERRDFPFPCGKHIVPSGVDLADARLNATMGCLGVEFLEPGMVLAQDVRAGTGVVLLGAGVEITERHIQIFRSWGVNEVDVEGGDREALNTEILLKLDVEKRAQIEGELDRLFQHNDPRDPVIEELRHVCLARAIARLAREN